MNLTKVIISVEENFIDSLVSKFGLEQKENTQDFDIFEGKRIIENQEEFLVVCFAKNIASSIEYVFENYQTDKIAVIGFATTLIDGDLGEGDVVIPNTFLTESQQKTFFLEYAIGENYDLKKFGLVLNGVCLSSEKDLGETEEYIADITDQESVSILEQIEKFQALDKTVVLNAISSQTEEKTKVSIENGVNILDLVL